MKIIITTIGNFNDSILLQNYILPSLQIINNNYISLILGIIIILSLFSLVQISDLNFIHFSSKKIGEKIAKPLTYVGGGLGAYSGSKEVYKDLKEALKNSKP